MELFPGNKLKKFFPPPQYLAGGGEKNEVKFDAWKSSVGNSNFMLENGLISSPTDLPIFF